MTTLSERWLPRPAFSIHGPNNASTSEPEAGAQCVRAAPAGICAGGGPLRAVPTATIKAITDYLANHNQNPKVFVWSAPVGRVMAKITKCKEELDGQQ